MTSTPILLFSLQRLQLTLAFALSSVASLHAGVNVSEQYVTPLGQYRSSIANAGNSNIDKSEYWHLGILHNLALENEPYSVKAAQASLIRSNEEGGISICFQPSVSIPEIQNSTEGTEIRSDSQLMSNFHVEGSARYFYFGKHSGYGAMSSLSGTEQILELIGNSEEEKFIFETGILSQGDYVFATSCSSWKREDYLVTGNMDIDFIVNPIPKTYPQYFSTNVNLELNQAIFGETESVIVDRLAIKGNGERPIEWKASMETPKGEVIEIFDIGYDDSLYIGSEVDFGPFLLFSVNQDTQKGVFKIVSRALDSETGELVGQDSEYIYIR